MPGVRPGHTADGHRFRHSHNGFPVQPGTTMKQDILQQFSDGLGALASAARANVVAIHGERHASTGLLWSSEVVLASEQALPELDRYEVRGANGERTNAVAAGRDPGTNTALLKLEQPLAAAELAHAEAKLAALASIVGYGDAGSITSRLALVHAVGDAWHSRAGGRIDRHIVLAARIRHAEDGAPVFDMKGGFLGTAAIGPRRGTLVIPAATLARVVAQLLKDGHIARGWLGVALQPVAMPGDLRESVGQTRGLMVMSLASESPAMQAGLLAGDIIVSIGGQAVGRMQGLHRQLGSESIGQSLDVCFIRAGAVETRAVTVSERPRT
jgi:S1-C subfamily serine protease